MGKQPARLAEVVDCERKWLCSPLICAFREIQQHVYAYIYSLVWFFLAIFFPFF